MLYPLKIAAAIVWLFATSIVCIAVLPFVIVGGIVKACKSIFNL